MAFIKKCWLYLWFGVFTLATALFFVPLAGVTIYSFFTAIVMLAQSTRPEKTEAFLDLWNFAFCDTLFKLVNHNVRYFEMTGINWWTLAMLSISLYCSRAAHDILKEIRK